jgi:hypothetical protein
MKLKSTNRSRENAGVASAVRKACLASRQKILAQVAKTKEAVFAESFGALKTHEHLLRLALNEAEATAWQTRYPHLLFPTLAMEKAQGVIAWNRRQQSIRRKNPILGLAA